MNNNAQIETVVHDAVKQYENVGYNREDDGTCALYVKGAEFGVNWQKQQYEAKIKVLEMCFEQAKETNTVLDNQWEAKYKELLDSHNELLEFAEHCYNNYVWNNRFKTQELINKAKNIKL
jgi:hypothetical protein